jgi:hypothetical protein
MHRFQKGKNGGLYEKRGGVGRMLGCSRLSVLCIILSTLRSVTHHTTHYL